MTSQSPTVSLGKEWHADANDGFHGTISADGPFRPEKGRYHLYIGLFCPFAHRVNIVVEMKRLREFAGLGVSVVRPYPKGDEKGWPGWRFNSSDPSEEIDDPPYEGSTTDPLFGSKYLHELYFKADKGYAGRYSVPVLWDKHLSTIVNNESAELMRDLQTCFHELLPEEVKEIDLFPKELREQIGRIEGWMQRDLNRGVYATGFAPTQETYERNLPAVFGSLNTLEKLLHSSGGPFLLGRRLTDLDIRLFATVIRFDVIYVQHFKCNLGTIRADYPVLHNWLKNCYWNLPAFRQTTDFRHVKENYTKSHYEINPRAITPMGPWPHVEEGVVEWGTLRPGGIGMEEVVEWEEKLKREEGVEVKGTGGFDFEEVGGRRAHI